MFIDATDFSDNTHLDCDICIIGGGPAGIVLANGLAETKLQICLTESGGLTPQSENATLSVSEQLENPVIVHARTKFFGGMSNAWGGIRGHSIRLRPLDPIDFEARPWVPNSGWPIAYQDLALFYERACRIMDEVPNERFKAEQHVEHLLDAFHDDVLRSSICQLPKPIRFGQQYRDSLTRAQNVRVLLNSHAIEIEEAESARTVSLVHAMTKTGRKHRLAAKIFVLACGGLETTRLLLASRRKHSRGVGNEHDLVGRFYMQHPKGGHGHLMLQRGSNAKAYVNGFRVNDCLMQASISLSEKLQREEGLLNHHVILAPLLQLSESHVAALCRRLHATWRQGQRGAALRQGTVAAAVDIPKVAAVTFKNALRSFSRGMMQYRVVNHLEQRPNPASRLELSEDTDRFGVPQLRTKWRIDTSEKRSLCRLHELLRDNLERCGIGSLRSQLNPEMDNWPISSSSSHDLGTVRMHDDPRRGVTDANGRVHSLHNLYVIGGALFPTSGSANPTLTIVALALRMADFLMAQTCGGAQATSISQE